MLLHNKNENDMNNNGMSKNNFIIVLTLGL